MDLKDFVHSSIVQIAKGIMAAESELEPIGGAVNPSDFATGSLPDTRSLQKAQIHRKDGDHYVYLPYQNLKFDVAVYVENTKKGGAGGSLQVAGALSIGGKAEKSDISQQTSRIQFDIPVVFPCHNSDKDVVSWQDEEVED